MRYLARAAVLCALLAAPALAQRPDSTRRPLSPRDSAARADSIKKAVADSIALMRELEKEMAPPAAPGGNAPAQPAQGVGPTNPRMLPDFSAVGDLLGDLSPKRSTQEDGTRFGVREVELAVQAVVDPYFRGDVFLGVSDAEGVSIEQAYLTATALPAGLEARLGRYLMPFGKQNTTHRHDLHTVEHAWVTQRFLGPEGLKGTGLYASKVFSPFGFYQELQVTAVDRLGERADSLVVAEPVNKELSGLAFSARLRNYVDLSQSTNFELSFSAMTGKREQPAGLSISCPACLTQLAFALDPYPDGTNAVAARQSLYGADLTFRWRPLQQGLYKSFILQAEVMRQVNGDAPGLPPCPALPLPAGYVCTPGYAGPTRDFSGAYTFARWQLTRRLYLGGRYDWLQDPELNGGTLNAGSGYLEWFPSEFSKLTAAYERVNRAGLDGLDRILLQASFAVGPHKPHPF